MALRVRRRCGDLPTVLVSFGMPPLYSALTGHTALQSLRPALDPDIEVGKWSPVGGHPLLGVQEIETDDVAAYLSQVGNVFVVHRGHDSNNSSAGVTIQAESWFVKWATDPEAVSYLESAVRFHATVAQSAIVALRHRFRTPSGMAVVHDWATGEVLNDPLVPGGLPREDPDSALARFCRLPVAEVLGALDLVFDAHLAVARCGFVAVDFYDGCLIYDFDRRMMRLCDLDLYRPGPYLLDRDRQYGSTRFMAPEEFERGAMIDERTTIFTLGRAAIVLLSSGDRERWRADQALRLVTRRGTRPEPADRYKSVAELVDAWRTPRGGG
jgi:serine/threonine protein kinase